MPIILHASYSTRINSVRSSRTTCALQKRVVQWNRRWSLYSVLQHVTSHCTTLTPRVHVVLESGRVSDTVCCEWWGMRHHMLDVLNGNRCSSRQGKQILVATHYGGYHQYLDTQTDAQTNRRVRTSNYTRVTRRDVKSSLCCVHHLLSLVTPDKEDDFMKRGVS